MTLDRNAPFLLFTSLSALAAVLIAQYGFGLLPCALCLYQRVPYGVTAALAVGLLGLKMSRRQRDLIWAVVALSFLTGAGLALYHTGVEQHWWAGPASCTSGAGGAKSIDDLIALLSKPVKIPLCDEVAWSLFGISMAGYNFLASILLTGWSAWAARRLAGKNQ